MNMNDRSLKLQPNHSDHQSTSSIKPNPNSHNIDTRFSNNKNTPVSANSIYSGQFSYSSQTNSSPLIHTFNSEWVDSPDNSPSRIKYYNQDMSATSVLEENSTIHATQTEASNLQKMATPSKPKASISFLTPVTDSKTHDTIVINEKQYKESPVTPKHRVTTMDIFWAMLHNITGKDKMAKVGQFTLRLLLHHAKQIQDYQSDGFINIDIINKRYNNQEKKLNLIRNFLHHPQNFIRIIVILVCSIFRSRFAGLVGGLSLFRQFLRFGQSPFKIFRLSNKIRSRTSVSSKSKDSFNDIANLSDVVSREVLGDVLSLYYSVFDEAGLLFKMKFFRNKPFHKVVQRHESLAWYYETLLGIYNSYERVQKLTQEEMDIKIQIQVKNKSRLLSKQLLGVNSTTNFSHEDDTKDVQLLKEIQFKRYNSYIDIYKWLSDFIYNTYTVFDMALPFSTLQIWMGISASSLSTIKLYRETKKRLIAESLNKQ